ncbi:inner centromere protein A-like [Ischnura elegans]|uniref:inner centromere protein A-like n=1 Tax=Ischnura elegans TaxID=197161 RepID=UPI001ED88EBA|nr:inner centromere protein A-like [Ischnura elegans]XP_046391164.1 inner centromere protein A-like [Ischnura elegans]
MYSFASMDLKMCEALAAMPSKPIQSCILADNKDLERLRYLCARYAMVKEDNTCKSIAVEKEKKEKAAEDKENFLMPAPKMPVRSGVRKRKTSDKSIAPRSSRVTRSSRMTGVMPEDVSMTGRPKRSRATRATQVLSPGGGGNETDIACDSDSSMAKESKRSIRGTKTVKEAPLRTSRRVTRARASSRIGAHVSTLANTSSSSHGVAISIVDAQVEEVVRPAQATRAVAGKVSHVIVSEEHFSQSPSQHLKKTLRQKSLFCPYSKNSVKEKVEAFEGLSSTGSIGKQGRAKENAIKNANVNGSSEGTLSEQDVNTSSVLIKGGAEVDTSAMEVDEMDVMVEELLKTSHTDEEDTMQSKGNKNNCTYTMNADSFKKDENESNDEWMTDDEDKPSGKKEKISDNYCTPKQKSSTALELAQEVLNSYKALRNRKVKHASSEMSLALNTKGKITHAISKSTTHLATLASKQAEAEIKEAELKRQQEKEMEAIKRKKELLKKRTEAAKKKREEKMTKVKRTREEKEKELEAKKTKKTKVLTKKKKEEEQETEVVEKKTHVKVAKLQEQDQLNSTFTKDGENDEYNMTPHWADVSPKQPANLNDYGVVDNSDCSSEEENDPRKKVPQWTKGIRLPLLSQSFIPTSISHEFWQTKPRALNIQQLFGSLVSKKTLKRGLNYRTSSAVWLTPPSKCTN